MTVSITSPITGTAQTGLTSPTYTVVTDTPPNAYSKQVAVTALGGTQSGVDVQQASKPFTITISRPANIRVAPVPSPVTGIMPTSPRNVYSVLTRKGVVPGASQNPQIMLIRTDFSVVAGSDLQEPANIRAAVSAHIGTLDQISSGLGDTLVTGTLG